MAHWLDPVILPFFRLTGVEGIDGILGAFLLSLGAAVVGEFTISLVFRVNRGHLDRLNADLRKYDALAQQALELDDRPSYKALNKQANDAYGQVFFNKFGLSAASLWPAFFALDWMQPHFAASGVPLPGASTGANYVVVFLGAYILARIVFGRLKRHLPYFKGQHRMLMSYGRKTPAADEAALPRPPAA
jgi:hypothetical protein